LSIREEENIQKDESLTLDGQKWREEKKIYKRVGEAKKKRQWKYKYNDLNNLLCSSSSLLIYVRIDCSTYLRLTSQVLIVLGQHCSAKLHCRMLTCVYVDQQAVKHDWNEYKIKKSQNESITFV
jgi:hypothetical protein